MNRGTIGFMLALAVALGVVLTLRGGRASAQAPEAGKEKRSVSTSGTATVRIKPDAARVFFGVQTFSTTVQGARARCKGEGSPVRCAPSWAT